MLRLLIGITLSEVGGSQKVVYSILSNLPEDVYDVTLVTSPGGELLDWVKELNSGRENKIRVVILNCIRRNISPLWDLVTLISLVCLMRKTGFNVAHFHNSKMGLLGRLAAKISGIPKVYYTVHGWGLSKGTTGVLYPLLSRVERAAARLTTKVVFVSQSDLEEGIRKGWAYSSDSCLIYNGISDISFVRQQSINHLKLSEDLPVIAFVARLSDPKDPLFIIRVSGQLLKEGYNHMLVIIGDGPKLDACIELIRMLGIDRNVILLGKRDNVVELLMEADIFCLFSKWEGLPISILEAMYCGLPVIANGVGGIPELIEHGKTGYVLYDYDIRKAAEYLEELIRDRDGRIRLGMEGRMVAHEKFNLAGMVNQYRELYEA